MTQPSTRNPNRGFAALRRFAERQRTAEVCELCSEEIAADHDHLLNLESRQLICACSACAILFASSETTRYRRVPRRLERWPDFQITDGEWDSFGIPIGLAFFVPSASGDRVLAHYPSPGGAIESLLPLDTWHELSARNHALTQLEPEVEALLVNRVREARDYFRVPIDECYKLVGIIRMNWRGISGGDKVWPAIAHYFADLAQRTTIGKKKSEGAP